MRRLWLWLSLTLGLVVSSASAQSPASPCSIERAVAGQDSPVVDALARGLHGSPMLETGAAGNVLVEGFIDAVCADPEVHGKLPSTCAPWGDQRGMPELRRRILRDLFLLPGTLLESSSAGPQLVVVAALLDTMATAASASDLARRLEHYACLNADATWLKALAMSIGDDTKLPPDVSAAARELQLARQRLDASHDPEEARRVARALGALLRESVDALPQRAGLLTDGAGAAFEAAATGDPIRVAEALASLLETDPDARALEILHQGARLASARDEDEAQRILRTIVLPVGPWAENLLFDINGLAVTQSNSEVEFGGDVTLGWNEQSWGIAARGALLYYDLQSAAAVSNTVRGGGSADAWGVFGADSPLRLETRISAGGEVYDSDLGTTSGAQQVFSEETSVMARGALLGGLRYEPTERVALGVWLGGGVQYEFYDPLSVGPDGINLETEETLSALFEARLRGHFLLVPRWLALRVRADAKRYGITRDALSVALNPSGDVATTEVAVASTQLELFARAHLDAEVARFAGFVPCVTGGVDLISLTAPGAPGETTLVPVLGVGVRRAVF